MLRRTLALLIPSALLILAGPACALDYRSLNAAAVLYDAPSLKAKPLFVIAAGTPVELVLNVDNWSKVRDIKGDLTWVEKRSLSDKRTVLVRVDRAQVRGQADEKAPLVFEAERDVVLDLVEPSVAGWVKVRHRDGQVGYVKALQLWGL